MRSLFTMCTALLLTSCSGLLYYPTHHLHIDPASLKLHPEEINFQSADGVKLFGWRFRADPKRKPKGVVVLYHGNGENLSSHYITMLWAMPHGFDLFVFDYRGYGRSEGEPSPEGTVRDGEAALRWVNGQYQGTPIIVVGQSLGGAIALRNVIDLKSEIPIRAVVIEGSFPSYRRIGRDVLTRSWITWPFQWLGLLVLGDKYAPDGEIGKISPVPLLVLHAEGDKTVPYRFGEEIFWQAGEPRELWKVPGAGHTDAFLAHGKEYVGRLLGWLERQGIR